MTVFLCQDTLDGILCGVYDAWTSRLGHSQVKLQIETCGNIELFCEYRNSEVTEEKTEKVISSICGQISKEVYELVFKASLSNEDERADKIYRFLILGFHYGASVTDMLQVPAVFEIFRICRFVGHEAHLITGFARFSQMSQGILLGKIKPKNDVLMLVAPHFADRLSGENWILYDEGRKKAAVYKAAEGWLMVRAHSAWWEETLSEQVDEKEYQKLWTAFHKSISISSRENKVCQRNHLAYRYRPYMTEFSTKI